MSANKFSLPESGAVRRLAAALASASRVARVGSRRFDLTMPTRQFFRRFPWTGKFSSFAGVLSMNDATVGQFFEQFNWDGHPIAQETSTQEVRQ